MSTDYMYDLAFKFKASKIWKTVYEQEMFAVKLPDGQIGYCQIMGIGGDHIAVAVYIGEKGYRSYTEMLDVATSNPYASSYDLLTQDCIQCSLENKEFLDKSEIAEVRAYAKKRGIALRGANAYPHYTRFRPYCVPWFVTDDNDIAAITLVMEAVGFIIDKLQVGRKWDLGLVEGGPTIPLFVKDGETFTVSETVIPDMHEEKPPEPQHINDLLIGKLKRLGQSGTLQCEVTRAPAPVQNNPDEVPHLTPIFLTLDVDEGNMLKPVFLNQIEIDPDKMLDGFINVLLETKCYPKEIEVQTAQTAAILREFCTRAKIDLIECDEMEEMNDAIESLKESVEQDGPDYDAALEEMLNEMAEMTDEQFAVLPELLKDHLLEMKKRGLLPEKLAKRL